MTTSEHSQSEILLIVAAVDLQQQFFQVLPQHGQAPVFKEDLIPNMPKNIQMKPEKTKPNHHILCRKIMSIKGCMLYTVKWKKIHHTVSCHHTPCIPYPQVHWVKGIHAGDHLYGEEMPTTLAVGMRNTKQINLIAHKARYHTLACWISSLLQSFDGSNVKEILTSLVATTSTDIPKSSKVENTCTEPIPSSVLDLRKTIEPPKREK